MITDEAGNIGRFHWRNSVIYTPEPGLRDLLGEDSQQNWGYSWWDLVWPKKLPQALFGRTNLHD